MLRCFILYRMADQGLMGIKQLMEATGLSRNAVVKLFQNQNVRTLKLDTLLKVCDALHCKLSDLMEYEPEPPGETPEESGEEQNNP